MRRLRGGTPVTTITIHIVGDRDEYEVVKRIPSHHTSDDLGPDTLRALDNAVTDIKAAIQAGRATE